MSSTKFVFWGLIFQQRWLPWPLIGWHISISEYLATTKWILLSILFCLCIWADLSRKIVTLGWPVIDWHTLSSTTILCRKALNLLYPWYMYQCQYRHPCPHVKSKFKCFKVLEFQSFSEYIFSCIFIFYPSIKAPYNKSLCQSHIRWLWHLWFPLALLRLNRFWWGKTGIQKQYV